MTDWAGQFARSLRGVSGRPLVVGLSGDLGSGKTTWARAMLRGLGYTGRVPSPTYTLLEHYALGGLDIVHLDLYRLASDAELENLGLRDWLSSPATWLLVEWPERAPRLAAQCDLTLKFAERAEGGRAITFETGTAAGIEALQRACHADPNNAR
jgi:tRNA threonylcarbamoyladenosine biosynthesis protein TsaE